jgi:phage terminase large subunit
MRNSQPQLQRPVPRPQLYEEAEAAWKDYRQAKLDTESRAPEDDPDILLPSDQAYAEIIGGSFDATDFDFRHSDYSPIFQRRADALAVLQERPGLLVQVKKYYADHPADFISDWANTFNPLNPGQGLPTTLPFVLFQRQREWIDYVLWKWHNRERGITEKSREVGLSWLAVDFSSTMCLFNREFVVGLGSYKKEYVDEAGSPNSLFWKARFFIEHLPQEFRSSWDKSRHAPQYRIFFPDTGSVIFGDVGDELGCGGRSALFFVDEAARLAHPELVEASLSHAWVMAIDAHEKLRVPISGVAFGALGSVTT